jgi:hypothetical protein
VPIVSQVVNLLMGSGRRIVLALALALVFAACGLISFDVSQDIPAQTVQGSPIGALLPAGLFDIPVTIDVAAATKAQGTGPASSAYLKSLTLSMVSPDGATFEFLDSVVITVSGSGLADKEVARLDSVPATPQIAIPPAPGVDLLPYIKAGATLKASATGHMPSQTITYNGNVTVTVKV